MGNRQCVLSLSLTEEKEEKKEVIKEPEPEIEYSSDSADDEPEELRSLRRQFDAFDYNKTGFLERGEFELLMRRLYVPNEEDVEALFSQFVFNEGKIIYDDYWNRLSQLNRDGITVDEAKYIFEKYDGDEDLVLNEEELRGVCSELASIDLKLSDKGFMLFDMDCDERISFDEFINTIQRLKGDFSVIWKKHKISLKKGKRSIDPIEKKHS